MRDIIAQEVKGTHISFIGVFLILFGAYQLFQWVIVTAVASIFALTCGLVSIGIVISIAYIFLGFGLLSRCDWAFIWTPILMIVMIVIYICLSIITYTGFSVISIGKIIVMVFIAVIVVHVAILGIVVWDRKRYRRERRIETRTMQPLRKEEINGLTCEKCGSENLAVYPDGSGICTDCSYIFRNVRRKP
ncbi:MAG: hypothetical protein ACE5KV_08385 [Thermoplasmata archaeon]